MENKEKRIAITGGTGFVGKSLMKKINTDSFKEVRVIRSKDHDLRKLDEATEAFKDIDFNGIRSPLKRPISSPAKC